MNANRDLIELARHSAEVCRSLAFRLTHAAADLRQVADTLDAATDLAQKELVVKHEENGNG